MPHIWMVLPILKTLTYIILFILPTLLWSKWSYPYITDEKLRLWLKAMQLVTEVTDKYLSSQQVLCSLCCTALIFTRNETNNSTIKYKLHSLIMTQTQFNDISTASTLQLPLQLPPTSFNDHRPLVSFNCMLSYFSKAKIYHAKAVFLKVVNKLMLWTHIHIITMIG